MKHPTAEMRVWIGRVELEESVAQTQLERLQEELFDLLPEIYGKAPTTAMPQRKVNKKQEASDQWDEPPSFPDTDDNRIVALLARRVGE
ncbi:MAG: hypothetical protein NXH94_19585 [Rhodobacteraceae bacterium]|uniref:hypothetical protein n=2 Tax=unclassified Marivita TaxID=2632480 RepID=UPI0025BE9BC0|nr:hypothetical protein [Marivita sp. XM-24bin2]MCR9111070.1 hypothetical protein [Paracoccaceae bacterium]